MKIPRVAILVSVVLLALAIFVWRSHFNAPAHKNQTDQPQHTASLVQQPEAVKQPHAPSHTRVKVDARKSSAPKPENEQEREPRPDQPDEALRWRMLQMVDENGRIPANALIKAWERARRMPIDSRAWPKREKNE